MSFVYELPDLFFNHSYVWYISGYVDQSETLHTLIWDIFSGLRLDAVGGRMAGAEHYHLLLYLPHHYVKQVSINMYCIYFFYRN